MSPLAACDEKLKCHVKTKDRAATTLSFVAPDAIVPIFVSQIRSDLDPSIFAKVTDERTGAWRAPEGTSYVDGTLPIYDNLILYEISLVSLVLSSKPEITITRKGKDADIEKWEAELRASLSSKKVATNGTAPNLGCWQNRSRVN